MSKPTKAVIYARFSPRPNAAECESIETQVEACQRYATEKGYKVVDVFADPEKSGENLDRPNLLAALEALQRGSVLIIHHLDRLARNLGDQEIFYAAVRNEKHARIEVVVGDMNGEDMYRVALRQMQGVFAELDRKQKAARTKMAMLRHQAAGRRMSLECPYGTSRFDDGGKKRLIDNPDEQDVIARIMREHEAGYSNRRICRGLETDGIPSRGKSWYHQTIKAIIRRAKTEG